MVENEITRLESQISQLQSDMKKEKEINNNSNNESKSKQWQSKISNNNNNNNNPHGLPIPYNNNNNSNQKNSKELKEKVAFETKALHFISKAIKGDYHLSDFSISNTDHNGMNWNKFPHNDQKENDHNVQQDEVETFPSNNNNNKASKKISSSGMVKPPSPMREPRQPTPRVCMSISLSSLSPFSLLVIGGYIIESSFLIIFSHKKKYNTTLL